MVLYTILDFPTFFSLVPSCLRHITCYHFSPGLLVCPCTSVQMDTENGIMIIKSHHESLSIKVYVDHPHSLRNLMKK